MEEVMKKLALWHTKTFRPIPTHDHLEPIMASLGFVPLNAPDAWRQYAFSAAGTAHSRAGEMPTPRLPAGRIDGLHLVTYRAFVDAVGFFIGPQRVADHFHVRGMPLHRVHDRIFDKVFRPMNHERRVGEDEGMFVFREGTLDQTMSSSCHSNTGASSSTTNNVNTSTNSLCLVPLKDIIVLQDIAV